MSDSMDNLPPLTGHNDGLDDECGPFHPGEKVGTYEVVDEIGRGGMCIVYKATDSSLKRTVALKVLRPSLARREKIARRFHHESVLSANLSHEGIAPIYSMEYHPPGLPYFTMELIEGETIDSLVRARGPMDPAQAVDIARQVAATLVYAHSRDVIHRDITPRNILLDESTGRVRVVDFGIAQDTAGTIHETYVTQDSSFGTLPFMSPEQNLSSDIDRRSDVFSLGMTLHFMLTGQPAYPARNRAELALAFRMRSPAPPSELNPDVPSALDAVVSRMIAVDPDDRYDDCDAAARALTDAIEVPEPAKPAAPHRRFTVVRALAVLLLVGAVVAVLVGLDVRIPLDLSAFSPEPRSGQPTGMPASPPAPSRTTPPAAAATAGEDHGFVLFGPIPSPPALPEHTGASPGEADAFAAEIVDGIEIPVPPADWTAPEAPADGSELWLKHFAPTRDSRRGEGGNRD